MNVHKHGVLSLADARAAQLRSKRGEELTVIPEIGATVQDFLYGLGFRRIRQIADLSDSDIARIQKAIDDSEGTIVDAPGRILRWKVAAQVYLERQSTQK